MQNIKMIKCLYRNDIKFYINHNYSTIDCEVTFETVILLACLKDVYFNYNYIYHVSVIIHVCDYFSQINIYDAK